MTRDEIADLVHSNLGPVMNDYGTDYIDVDLDVAVNFASDLARRQRSECIAAAREVAGDGPPQTMPGIDKMSWRAACRAVEERIKELWIKPYNSRSAVGESMKELNDLLLAIQSQPCLSDDNKPFASE